MDIEVQRAVSQIQHGRPDPRDAYAIAARTAVESINAIRQSGGRRARLALVLARLRRKEVK